MYHGSFSANVNSDMWPLLGTGTTNTDCDTSPCPTPEIYSSAPLGSSVSEMSTLNLTTEYFGTWLCEHSYALGGSGPEGWELEMSPRITAA